MSGTSFDGSRRRSLRMPKTATKVAALLGLALAGLLASSATANAEVLYNNIPSPVPGNLPSQPFQAQQAAEFGGQIQLAGTERQNATVTVGMSSWACQTGGSDPVTDPCATTPGSTFSHPITLNVYAVGPSNAVGNRLISITRNFQMPFRPSQDNAQCAGTVKWFDPVTATCKSGLLFTISYALGNLTLPDRVIVSLAYNTQTWGYDPIGTDGPYNSLNVAMTDGIANPSGTPPSTGSDPIADSAYFNTHTAGNYCDTGTGGIDVFRLDSGCWTGFQPILNVSTPQAATTGGGGGGVGAVAGATGSSPSTPKCKKHKKHKTAVAAKKCKKKKKK
jgi:hypothetical protein